MPARNTYFAPECYYHVFNRGSEKRIIFQSPKDYTKFLLRLKENSEKYAIDILCYNLMPNHFHLLVKQQTDASVAHFMKPLQLSYAKFFNTKYARIGPLFQGRYKAKIIETDEYLLQASGYIHRQPVANLVDSGNHKDSRNLIHARLLSCPYSSYHAYIKGKSDGIAKPEWILQYFSQTNPQLSYQSFVEEFVPDIEALTPILATTE